MGNIAHGVSNFIIGSNEKEYNLRNVAKASVSIAKPIIGHVSEFVESGRNSISDSFIWKDFHRGYISTDEAIDLASTTAREVDSSEPEEFKAKYEEKLKSRSQMFSYPTPRLDSLSEILAAPKARGHEFVSNISSHAGSAFEFLKSGSLKVLNYGKELLYKVWRFVRNSSKCGDQIILCLKKNWGTFRKYANRVFLSIRNNPLEFPKRIYHFIYGFFHSIYDKIYHYRHPEVHKSKISALGSSLKNIGFPWR